MAKLGAVFYVIWGLLHLMAARMVYGLAQTLEPGMVQARVLQDAFNLAFFAVFAIVVAILYNWKNSRLGYWLNFWVISIADIGFILIVMVPLSLPLMPAALGPLFWILALVFSTIAIRQGETT